MLKAGIIGLGRMGLTHMAILRNHPDVQVTAVCDSSRFTLCMLCGPLKVKGFTDYAKMLKRTQLDMVVVCTPPQSHAAIAREALGRKIHVFMEKPLSLSAAESEELADLAERAGIVNQVGYVNRFHPIFKKVRQLLGDGLVGQIRTLRSEMYGGTVLRDSTGAWRTQSASGGGCLHEFASHSIDLVHYLLGPADSVTGSHMQRVYSSQAEDAVQAILRYDKQGLTAGIEANWSDPSCRKPTNRLEIIGTCGKLTADKYGYKVFLSRSDPSGHFGKGWAMRDITATTGPVRFYLRGNEFTEQLDHFVSCVKDRTMANRCTFRDGWHADRIIEQIARNC